MDLETLDTRKNALRAHVGAPNFVYVVGYSLERTHSGVLTWLLRAQETRRHAAAELWNHASPDGPSVSAEDIREVTARHEAGISKKAGFLDLLVELKIDKPRWLLVEYKVDGSGDHDRQCKAFRDEWLSSEGHDEESSRFLLVTTGGARFWDTPEHWAQLEIRRLHKILEPWADIPLIGDYREALEDERVRGDIALETVAPAMGKEEAARLGYRLYDRWYAYYHSLRKLFPAPCDWAIYSGGRNPVLNWSPAWPPHSQSSRTECSLGRLYCEFNWSRFFVKLAWKEGVERDAERLYAGVDRLGDHLKKACLAPTGRRNRNPKDYSTLARRQFPAEDPDAIVAWVTNFVPEEFLSLCQAIRGVM